MPQPTSRQVHIDTLLTNISVAYMQTADMFVAPKVFPVVPVDKQSDKYIIYPKGDWFRDEAQRLADTDESVGSGYTLDNAGYRCDVWAFHKDIGDQARLNADAQINLERDATQFVMSRLLLRLERQWTSDFFTTGVWGTDNTPTNLWSDYTASDPIEDMEVAKEAIISVTGRTPNTLVMGYQVFRKLQNHPDIIDRYKYTSSQVITEDLLARLFGVDRVLVMRGIYNSADEGATPVFNFIQGKNALLCYVPDNPGLLQPSSGYTFVWRGISQGLGEPSVIQRFRIDERHCERIEGMMAFDNKVVGADLGYFFSGAVA
jgi:hypothetical protein